MGGSAESRDRKSTSSFVSMIMACRPSMHIFIDVYIYTYYESTIIQKVVRVHFYSVLTPKICLDKYDQYTLGVKETHMTN